MGCKLIRKRHGAVNGKPLWVEPDRPKPKAQPVGEPMLLSVLIPAYQASETLSEAVESVLGCSMPLGWRLEVLIGVDGLAEQATEAVARDLAERDARVQVWSWPHSGTWRTTNRLLWLSRGELVTRADADDLVREDRWRVLIELLAGADIAGTWHVRREADGSESVRQVAPHGVMMLWDPERAPLSVPMAAPEWQVLTMAVTSW